MRVKRIVTAILEISRWGLVVAYYRILRIYLCDATCNVVYAKVKVESKFSFFHLYILLNKAQSLLPMVELTLSTNPLFLLVLNHDANIRKQNSFYCASTLHPKIIGVDVSMLIRLFSPPVVGVRVVPALHTVDSS